MGTLVGKKCNQHKTKTWSWCSGKRKKPPSWQEQLADELHKPIKRKFIRRRVIAKHIGQIWTSDLVDRQPLSKFNKGFKYLFMVIDVFSKYGWIRPLKDKKGETVTEAFKSIFKEGRKPQYLWTDKGKEFYNKHLKELLDTVLCKSNASELRRNSWLFGAFRRNIAQSEMSAKNRQNFVTPIVSFRAKVRAIICAARTFEAKFRAIIRALLEISRRFFERTFVCLLVLRHFSSMFC